jgi:DnaK suppressor protein
MTTQIITPKQSNSQRNGPVTGVRSLKKSDLARFRQLLRQHRDELVEDLRILKESLRAIQEKQQGIGSWNLDFARDSADTESSESIAFQIRRLSDTLSQVSAALVRIENGKFGICVRCGDLIDIERLSAIPFTRRCIACSTNQKQT